MKESNYNYYTIQDDKYLCLNGITGATFALDKDSFLFMKELMADEQLQQEHSELTSRLTKTHFLVNNMNDEFECLLEKHRQSNRDDTWHLIINPTQDCNFRCWYCYEKHPQGRMDETTILKVKKLIDNILKNKKLTHFSLSWFGGEPLLYFNEVIYPISVYLKERASEHNVTFSNSITTNGFLFTSEMIKKCVDIHLNSFQITLDGNRETHNKIRHQNGKPSFDTILQNTILLAHASKDNKIRIRVNYNTRSIQADFGKILDIIPQDLRNQYSIQFQRIWQTYEKEGNDDFVKNVLQKHYSDLKMMGYKIVLSGAYNIFRGLLCYADKTNYANINYDGKIYRCTAQDYTPKRELGYLDEHGNIIWNERKTKGINDNAFFNNKTCLACELLPLCGGPCFYKWWSNFKDKELEKCPFKDTKSDVDLSTFIKKYYEDFQNKRQQINSH